MCCNKEQQRCCDRNTRKPRKFKQTKGRLRSFRGVLGPGSDMSEERMTTLLSQQFYFFFTLFGFCFQGRFNIHQIVFSLEYEAPMWRYSFEKVRPQHKHTQVQQHLHDETKNKETSPRSLLVTITHIASQFCLNVHNYNCKYMSLKTWEAKKKNCV